MNVILKTSGGNWLRFLKPKEILVAYCLDEVIPILERAQSSDCYVAGYISYEASSAFDNALITYPSNGFPLVLFGLYESVEYLDSLPEFSLSGCCSDIRPSISEEVYSDKINKIKDHISEGYSYQINYTYSLLGSFSGDPYGLFYSLVQSQDTDYAGFIEYKEWAICSASPELFFSLEDGVIRSIPMKGTIARGRTLDEDVLLSKSLKNSEKNKSENIMIVDMIRNDLGRIAKTGSINVSDIFKLERYKTLWQMTSTVQGVYDGSILEIFRALFPCASITGAPKIKTMELIKELEGHPRGIYTGSIGYWTPKGTAQFNVAIRTALIDMNSSRITYGVGSGIVWDSDAKSEYIETLIKAEVLLGKNPDFDLLETMAWLPEKGIVLKERHLERLSLSAKYFDINYNRRQVIKLLDNLNDDTPLKIRILINKKGEVKIEKYPLTVFFEDDVIELKLASKPIDKDDIWLYHKTTNRSVYANAESEIVDCDDVVLWNINGEVTEGTFLNIAIEENGQWITPPVNSGLLAGIMRQRLLDSGEIKERVITIDELKKTKKIRVFNSVRGVCDAVLKTSKLERR